MTKRAVALGALAAGTIAAVAFLRKNRRNGGAPLQTVPHVDLEQYSGRWFEIARLPNFFERNCARNSTAEYTIAGAGSVRVENQCTRSDGRIQRISGTARVIDRETNAKLKVKFSPLFPSGDYWIIGLDFAYRWAIVGDPSRKFLWVLSRTPGLDGASLDRIYHEIAEAGYDTSAIVRTHQDGG